MAQGILLIPIMVSENYIFGLHGLIWSMTVTLEFQFTKYKSFAYRNNFHMFRNTNKKLIIKEFIMKKTIIIILVVLNLLPLVACILNL